MTGEADFLSIFQLGIPLASVFVLLFLALVFSSYVKIVTVLAILRAGLGFYSVPSAFVTGGLAFSLALFVMYPTMQLSADAVQKEMEIRGSDLSNEDQATVILRGMDEWKKFVRTHTHQEERLAFVEMAKRLDQKGQVIQPDAEAQVEEVVEQKTAGGLDDSWRVLAPAFLVSELKEAFATGVSLFLPFLVVELLVAAALASTGLNQLSPHIVAFPFKLLLFVALDGWTLITTNLAQTYI
jgi:type III secretion protein R